MLDPVGFWSYARLDDEHRDGHLSQLRAIVGKQIGMQHGDRVTLWQDIQAIPYGADWAATIEETIGKTTFFIPIVTPRFLKSANCRDEYLSYRRRMLALGRDDLIFPVHYVNVDDLRPEDTLFGDDLATLRRAQWIDFRGLFYADPKSAEVRRGAGDFAGGILQAMRREAPRRVGAGKAVERAAEANEGARGAIAAKVETPPAPPAAVVREAPPITNETAQPLRAQAPPPDAPRFPSRDRVWTAWGGAGLVVVALIALGVSIFARSDKVTIAVSPPTPTVSPFPAATGSTPAVLASASSTPAPEVSTSTPAPSTSVSCFAGLLPRTVGVLSADEECALIAKDEFRECTDCPKMVLVPAGNFVMGSPESEHDRNPDEGPQHHVTIASAIAVGKFPITVGEFRAFVTATNYDAGANCLGWKGKAWEWQAGHTWRDPGFPQTDAQPVTCVNWDDAQAYVKWLAGETGKPYRLLSEAEWEYSARGGTTTAYFWGDEIDKRHANCNGCGSPWDNKQTSPVGSFAPNAFGLYDMAGNAWQWTEDCYRQSYKLSDSDVAPADGSAWTSRDCSSRVLRGGSWSGDPWRLHTAWRFWRDPAVRSGNTGFRVARTFTP